MIFVLFLSMPHVLAAQTEFREHWRNPKTPIIIDAFHGNRIDWKRMKTDPRVAAIIHKATEGTDISDPLYSSRRARAKQLGYIWGSYHLLKNGDPEKQARFYLQKIGTRIEGELMALDVECTTGSNCSVEQHRVSVDQIKAFLAFIKKHTGRYPVFYGNQTVVKDLSDKYPGDIVLTRVPLWYARFKSRIDDFPEGIWTSYSIWQFSSEINCRKTETYLYSVPGTLSDMDISVFNGTFDELGSFWERTGK